MEISRINEDIKFLNQLGYTLPLEERMKLHYALLKIYDIEGVEKVFFWGKIEGIKTDYFIAVVYQFKGIFEFPTKKFYWSDQEFVFQEMPPFNLEYKERVDTFNRQLFTGQATKLLIQVEGDGADGGGDPQPPADQDPNKPVEEIDSDIEVKPPPKNFSELERLSYVVHAIEYECAIVPVGAYRMNPQHELQTNQNFQGLTQEEALIQKNYQHFRAPLTTQKKQQIARDDVIFSFDFLDPIDGDLPKGQWSVQHDATKTLITVRNLIWPGFFAYHQVQTGVFGYFYKGDGIKNTDFAFLLH